MNKGYRRSASVNSKKNPKVPVRVPYTERPSMPYPEISVIITRNKNHEGPDELGGKNPSSGHILSHPQEKVCQQTGNRQSSGQTKKPLFAIYQPVLLQYIDACPIARIGLKRANEASPDDALCRKLLIKSYFPKALYPKLFWFNHWMRGPLPKKVNETNIHPDDFCLTIRPIQ